MHIISLLGSFLPSACATINTICASNGTTAQLPIYYKNKLYTDEEREKLWLHLLDKQERYILGQKIDISKDEELYYKLLKQAKHDNEQIGLNKQQTWEEQEYERQRRRLKQSEIMNKKKKEFRNKKFKAKAAVAVTQPN